MNFKNVEIVLRKTFRDLPVDLRLVTREHLRLFENRVIQGFEKEPNFWFFRHIILKPAETLPLLIVCSSQDLETIYGRFLLSFDTDLQVNSELPQAANFDNLQVYKEWEGKGICAAMLEYGESIASTAGYKWAEIGVSKGNVAPLSNYVRRHFHEHGVGIEQETKTARFYNVETSLGTTWLETPRYIEPSVVCYKSLEHHCSEHSDDQIRELTNNLLKLMP